MPVAVHIDKAAKVIFSTFIGDVSENDFRQAAEGLPAHPGFDSTFSHVIDCSSVTAINISTSFIREFAEQPPVFRPEARQIIVAPQDHVYGLARMAQILRERKLPNVTVVRSLQQAYEILGIQRVANE